MLFRTLRRLIEKKQVDGLAEKIDIFYAVGKLTDKEYDELIKMLNDLKESEEVIL